MKKPVRSSKLTSGRPIVTEPLERRALLSASAFHLVVTAEPTTTVVGKAITPGITVVEEDANGVVQSADIGAVTLVTTGPAGEVIGGTVNQPLVNGVATFSDVIINTAGSYTLSFSDGADVAASSSAFAVSADASVLSPTIVSTTLPAAVVSGASVHKQVFVTVNNTSANVSTGAVTVEVFASADGTVDGSSVLLGTSTRSARIRAFGHAGFVVAVPTIPISLNGTYNLFARVTDSKLLKSVSSAGRTLLAAAPFVAFSETFVGVNLLPASVSGTPSHAVARFKVTNNGNAVSTGLSAAQLFFTPDGVAADGAALPAVAEHIVLQPGHSRFVAVPLKTLPAVVDGNYFLAVRVTDPNGGVSQVNSPFEYTLAAPFKSLVPLGLTFVTAGNGSTVVTFTVTNTGNVFSNQFTTVNLIASTNGTVAAGTTVYTKGQVVKLSARGHRFYRIKLTAAQWNQVLSASTLVVQVLDASETSQVISVTA